MVFMIETTSSAETLQRTVSVLRKDVLNPEADALCLALKVLNPLELCSNPGPWNCQDIQPRTYKKKKKRRCLEAVFISSHVSTDKNRNTQAVQQR